MKGKHKRILSGFSIIYIICFITMLILGISVLNTVLIKPVEELERMSVQDNLSNIQNALDNKLNYLNTLATDWAVWDDSYKFVQDDNDDYLESNLPDSNYSNLDLNTMLYTDTSGKVVYGRTMRTGDEKSSEVSKNLLDDLKRLNVTKNTEQNYIVKGIINLPEGPMLVVSHPILKSDGSGPVYGNIVFGRYLDSSIINEISSSLNLNIGEDIVGDDEFGQIKSRFNQSYGILNITPINSDTIQGSEYYPDLFNDSAVKISVTAPRDVYKVGQTTVLVSIIAVAIIFIVILAILWALTNEYVIKRITKLHKDVRSIAENKNLSSRVEIKGRCDEIYDLSANINNLLNVTEELNNTIQENNKELKNRSVELTKVNSALVNEKNKIRHMAYHDSLTNLPNGVYFNDFLNRQIASSKRNGAPIAVLFIDLDGFKMINDTLGHAAGDELLVSVSRRLISVLRKSDFVARIGGDEFIILINSIKDTNDVEIIADKILKMMAGPFVVSGQECFISASVGISQFPTDGINAEELTKNADLAMYKAKDGGKNKYCFCSQEMKNQIAENMVLSNQLWRALERDEFELYYQPQVNCYTSKIIGMEALIRWHNPERGLVLPGKFISLAEQTGAINAIGEWVLKTACRQCKQWQEKYIPDLRMAVNLSIKQLQNNDIVYQVKDTLGKTGLNPSTLELEVTESVFVKEVEFVINILNKIKDLGVEISIDDFGTEYASMSYLKFMPVNRIKIAMPFVQGLDVSEKDQAITKAIIILAKNMGMSVIAEGVETKTQHEFLMQKLCDETQGFYFYRPLPAHEIEEILKHQSENKEFTYRGLTEYKEA